MFNELPLCAPIHDCRAWKVADFAEEAQWVRHFTPVEIDELEAMGIAISDGDLPTDDTMAIQAAIPSVMPLVLELAEIMEQGKGSICVGACPLSAGALS